MPSRDEMAPPDKAKRLALAGLGGLAVVAVCLLEPFPQDLAYHQLADQRRLFGLSNGSDVLSNLALLAVGLRGLQLWQAGRLAVDRRQSASCALFFGGVILTALGSAWYHLHPTNATLTWDRLPMTIAFMALSAFVVGDCVDLALGRRLLGPLLTLGVAAVLWWHGTEQVGRGDLRFYALVQFLPVVLLPLILILFRPERTRTDGFWGLFLCYGLAKLFEALDRPVFILTGLVSGHTLKHLAAAAGVGWFLRMLHRRLPRRR